MSQDVPRSGYEVVAAVAVLGLAGYVIGHVVMHVDTDTSPASARFAASAEFRVWSAIVAGQVAIWLMACPYLWHLGTRVVTTFAIRRRKALRPALIAAVAVGALLVVPFTLSRSGRAELLHASSTRINLLYALGVPVFTIALLTLATIELAARQLAATPDRTAGSSGPAKLTTLHGALRQSLTGLGVVVSIVVVATGAFTIAITSFASAHPEFAADVDESSPGHVLAYGALFVGVLLLVYAPAARAVNQATDALIDRQLPTTPDTPLLDQLKQRHDLRVALGVGASTEETLKRSIAVLSPLLTGALTYFLS